MLLVSLVVCACSFVISDFYEGSVFFNRICCVENLGSLVFDLCADGLDDS